MEKYRVTIHLFNNEGKQIKDDRLCDDLIAVTRFILTYTPKKGFDPVRFTVDKEISLF